MTEENIRSALLLYGLNDMLNLGWIEQTVSLLQDKERDDPALVESAVEAIRDLLEADYAVAGAVVKDPVNGLLMVKSWDLSPTATIEQIKQRREELDGRDRGYLVWLELTEKGREEARRLDEQSCNPFGDGRKRD